MLRWLLACLLVGTSVDCVLSARILAVLPLPVKSHQILFQAVLKTLAERGHQVVSYSPFPLDKPLANYTDVQLNTIPVTETFITKDMLQRWMDQSPVALAIPLWENVPKLLEFTFKNDKILELLQSKEQFDLVILESFFGQEIFLGFGHKFNAPVVSMLSFGSFHVVNRASGNSLSLPYIPDYGFSYSDHMTFYERLVNTYSVLISLNQYYTRYLPAQEARMRQLYNDPTMPPLVDMVHNVSLLLNNEHPFLHYARTYTPNLVPIGGIHLTTATGLSQKLKSFLDGAEHGVVYLSLGSAVPDHDMSQHFYEAFVRMFRRLPQRVLWKTGADLSGLPDNVMTVKWAPQQDILAHPKVSLFITHGGLLSMHETVNAGVPVLCIPIFADQPLNGRFYEEKGVGIAIPIKEITEDTLYTSVTHLLSTSLYKDNMRRLSAIYRDRPVSPADSLVFWVEYVLRHRGAHHLRPASAAMAWYQLALLDVFGFLLVLFLVVLSAIYLIFRKVYHLLFITNKDPLLLNDNRKKDK